MLPETLSVIDRFRAGGIDARLLARDFLAKDSKDIRRFALGRNEHTIACGERVRLEGIVDDFAPIGAVWSGLPVLRAAELPRDAVVVNCSMSIRPIAAKAMLERLSGCRSLSYADLMRADPSFPAPKFVEQFRNDYGDNRDKWTWLWDRLADQTSRTILSALIHYRLTGDIEHMHQFTVQFEQQYFDGVVALTDSEVFVDCGGYDGDTVRQFLSRKQAFQRIYMFEPSHAAFALAKDSLGGVANIELVPYAVSDSNARLAFDGDAGTASAVSVDGAATVTAVTLDDFIGEPVTFIKMDLEGWEIKALAGATRHIAHDHPKLAIAVYHSASDFWQVPQTVLACRDDYDVYLRHYTEGWSETVMYFIPRSTGRNRT